MWNGKTISMIAAMAKNRVIGAANDIPWRVPGEQQRFRKLTEGHLVVMGRRTYESIGRPLPNRDVLVIGRQSIAAERVSTCITLQGALEVITNDSRQEVFIAGGAQIYRLFLPYADTVYLTVRDLEPTGDATFPDLPVDFHCTEKVDVSGPTSYTVFTYRRATDHTDKLA
ncbi:dihydrofolate reductase [Burkholderia glumae]|uniref:dihydrofolate reductase n=1 Tax=Burkholderia glumae TaxID=337 RepID=UPI0020CBF134|nr:dihydrofolate reductase [Burkholderia glumae]MCQ0034620.1 dihydrofolate reductase [Burkholderia glumae]MCQ0040160.1 dihydrofolate reductase [Burkholderia glumae]